MEQQKLKTHQKVAVLYTLITASIILLLMVLVYFFAERFLSEDFYKRLEIRAVMIAHQKFNEKTDVGKAIQGLREEHLEVLANEHDYVLPLNAKAIADSLNVPQQFINAILQNGTAKLKFDGTYFAGVRYTGNSSGAVVIVSAENAYQKRQLKILSNILLIGFIVCTFFLFLAGWFFAKQIFLPIKKITIKVRNISTENLHLRLNVRNGKDEITELARTFNNMLDRLETSFESQNNFVSNASHELSTPLTTIIGESELALQKERDPEVYKKSIQIILQEANRLKAIIRSLLSLAQTGFDGKKQNWEPIRIDELINEVLQTAHQIYPNNKINMDYSLFPEDEEKLIISGNANLLKLAFTNIILNACKYSLDKEIIMSIAASNNKSFVVVKDSGIGIPEKDLQHIYQPFFRASNTGEIKGYGIGLPLTFNIVRMHNGEITVHSKVNVGTEVLVTLPIRTA